MTKNRPHPSIVSRRIVERALSGELSADALLDHIGQLEQKISILGQWASWRIAFHNRLMRMHRGLSVKSRPSAIANQILIDLDELATLKANLSKSIKNREL